MKTTTLNKIRQHRPCEPSWKKLLKSLDKTQADDEEIRFDYLIETLGCMDTIWCFRTLDDINISKWVALRCAELVRHLLKHQSDIDCLTVTRKYLEGTATLNELRESAATTRDTAAAAYAAAVASADAACAAACAADHAADAADYAISVVSTAYHSDVDEIKQILLEELSK